MVVEAYILCILHYINGACIMYTIIWYLIFVVKWITTTPHWLYSFLSVSHTILFLVRVLPHGFVLRANALVPCCCWCDFMCVCVFEQPRSCTVVHWRGSVWFKPRAEHNQKPVHSNTYTKPKSQHLAHH